MLKMYAVVSIIPDNYVFVVVHILRNFRILLIYIGTKVCLLLSIATFHHVGQRVCFIHTCIIVKKQSKRFVLYF